MTQFIKSLAVASVAAAALALPMTASASDYRKCKDTEAAVAGGLIGGSLGTVIGEEIAGRNNRTEGAIAGAVIGGVLGAAIGDGASDCEKDGRVYRNGRYIGDYDGRDFRNVHHRSNNRGYHHNRRGYNNHRGYNNRHDRGWNDGNGYSRHQHSRELRRIDRRMDRLRAERRELKDRRRYERRTRWIDRRLSDIAYELDYLKDERRRAKRAWDNRRNYRGYNHRRGY